VTYTNAPDFAAIDRYVEQEMQAALRLTLAMPWS
jgi:hypothetical protein